MRGILERTNPGFPESFNLGTRSQTAPVSKSTNRHLDGTLVSIVSLTGVAQAWRSRSHLALCSWSYSNLHPLVI
jgi:hypothetical protein